MDAGEAHADSIAFARRWGRLTGSQERSARAWALRRGRNRTPEGPAPVTAETWWALPGCDTSAVEIEYRAAFLAAVGE